VSETVYIETSVIGYLTARSTKNLIIAANIETTRDWWEFCRNDFILYASEAVLDEVAKGDSDRHSTTGDSTRLSFIGIESSRTKFSSSIPDPE